MKTPLAWLNLLHAKIRTAAAVAGVTFAVMLIFMQLGFLATVETTASMIYDALDFDLLLRASAYRCMSDARGFPRARLYQVAAQPQIAAVRPFYVGATVWQHPGNGQKRVLLAMGVTPGEAPFRKAELQQKSALLTVADFVLIDRQSRPEFGPQNGRQFGDADLGVETDVMDHRVRIVGHYNLGAGFAAAGSLMTNADGFCRLQPGWSADRVSLGLLKVAPGANPRAVAAQLRAALPEDVNVLTRDEVLAFERDIWVNQRSAGIIFQMGVAVALVVGTAIVYQILSADIGKHLREYATLRAMGYRGSFLNRIVLQEALILALLGFLPGWLLAVGLYRLTAYFTGLPIYMTSARVAFVMVLSMVMCSLSGLAALRKVRQADPADLF
jgi:putative ABC transport system permease protein